MVRIRSDVVLISHLDRVIYISPYILRYVPLDLNDTRRTGGMMCGIDRRGDHRHWSVDGKDGLYRAMIVI